MFQDAEVGCYVPGECLGAAYTEFEPLESPSDCHQLCIDTEGCQFWTHYGDDSGGNDYGCFAFLNCPSFDADSCDGCTSGEVDCPLSTDVGNNVGAVTFYGVS